MAPLKALRRRQIDETNTAAELPIPEKTGGMRGQLGIDKNINESNIDQYLGRDDSVYRDMRMLVRPHHYEEIAGDSYLSGYVEGFEVVPYPKIVNVNWPAGRSWSKLYAEKLYFPAKTTRLSQITKSRWILWNTISRRTKTSS